MRDVAVVSFAQSKHERALPGINEVEMLMPVVGQVRDQIGLDKNRVGFTCSGSTDYLAGQAFSFVMTLDGIGAWPPISESHVEMDAAWALYEAWVKLQMGEIDIAMVYGYSKTSPGDLPDVLTRQLDPYVYAPLWPDSISLAALQAQAVLDEGGTSEREWAEIAARSRASAKNNPNAQLTGDFDPEAILAEEYLVAPLRKHDCPPITDGAAAIILAADDAAREFSKRPAWIRGLEHRIDPQSLGVRNLTRVVSLEQAGEAAGVSKDKIDFAELHAPFTYQEVLAKRALGLSDEVSINPSGGALAANPMMAAGLVRIGEAADRIIAGEGDRAVASATQGACMQQNLVCVLEGE
jgi:acetyl-CoA acetyltransferase